MGFAFGLFWPISGPPTLAGVDEIGDCPIGRISDANPTRGNAFRRLRKRFDVGANVIFLGGVLFLGCFWPIGGPLTLAGVGEGQMCNALPNRRTFTRLRNHFVVMLEVIFPRCGFIFGLFLAYFGPANVGEGWRTSATAK